MKKLLIILTFIAIFLISCNTELVNNTDSDNSEVIQLKEELESQEKYIQSKDEELALIILENEQLEKKVEEFKFDIEHTEKQMILGKGYAMQFMYDLDELYNYLGCPQLPKTDNKTSTVIERLILELSNSESYSNKKIVSINIKENDDNEEEHYTFEVLMFSPTNIDQLSDSIDNITSPPFPAIRLYSITISVNEDEFNFVVN